MKVCNCRNKNETEFRTTLTNNFAGIPIVLQRGEAPNTLSAVYKDCTGGCDFNCGKCQDHLSDLCAKHNHTVATVEALKSTLPQPPATHAATIKPQSGDPVR